MTNWPEAQRPSMQKRTGAAACHAGPAVVGSKASVAPRGASRRVADLDGPAAALSASARLMARPWPTDSTEVRSVRGLKRARAARPRPRTWPVRLRSLHGVRATRRLGPDVRIDHDAATTPAWRLADECRRLSQVA